MARKPPQDQNRPFLALARAPCQPCARMDVTFPPSADTIEALARAALARMPAAFAAHLGNVLLRVEEFADDATPDALEIDDPFALTGLYAGRPVGEKSAWDLPRSAGQDPALPARDPGRVGGGRRDPGGARRPRSDPRGWPSFRAFGCRHARAGGGGGLSARLTFRDVACVRGGRLLFEGMGFALGPGEAGLVTGPNGVGKSSLLRDSGRAARAGGGRDRARGPDRDRRRPAGARSRAAAGRRAAVLGAHRLRAPWGGGPRASTGWGSRRSRRCRCGCFRLAKPSAPRWRA